MRSCSVRVEWQAIAHTGSSTSRPGRLASAKRPRRFGPLLDCRARFLTPPTDDGDSPPVEVTFPDGTVVRTDGR